jgi:hypothetical protein
VTCGVLLTTPSPATDQAIVEPPEHQYVVVAPPPPLLPPCREGFWATSLHCIPRTEIYAPNDPALLSYLRSLRPVKRRPYVQVFHW